MRGRYDPGPQQQNMATLHAARFGEWNPPHPQLHLPSIKFGTKSKDAVERELFKILIAICLPNDETVDLLSNAKTDPGIL